MTRSRLSFQIFGRLLPSHRSAPTQFVEEIEHEGHFVLRLGWFRGSHRYLHSQALAVRRQIEPLCSPDLRRAFELSRPNPRLLRREHIVLYRVLHGHDLVAGLIKQLAVFPRPDRKLSATVRDLRLSSLPGRRRCNARTYTSFFPESFELYASHRPSGENIVS